MTATYIILVNIRNLFEFDEINSVKIEIIEINPKVINNNVGVFIFHEQTHNK